MKIGERARKVSKTITVALLIILAMGVVIAGGSTLLSKTIQSVLNTRASGKEIAKVVTGEGYAFALKSDGTLWAWGSNANSQLGAGEIEDSILPVPVLDVDGKTPLRNVVDVTTYGNNIGTSTSISGRGGVALKSDGTVVAWGNNNYGELGAGIEKGTASNHAVQVIKEDGNPLTNVKQIDSGCAHTIAVTENGEIFTWGYNGYGGLGLGNATNKDKANKVMDLENVKDVTAGSGNSAVLLENGEMYEWGYNGFTQLAAGGSNPTKETQTDIKKVILTLDNMMILKNDGTVHVRGAGRYGQLGNGTTENSNKFVKVSGLTNIKDIGNSGHSFFALSESGEVYSWGQNNYGQLGFTGENPVKTPKKIEELTGKIYKLPNTDGREVTTLIDNKGNILIAGNGSRKLFGYDDFLIKTQNQNFEPYSALKPKFEPAIINLKKDESANLAVGQSEGINLFSNILTISGTQYESLDETIATVDKNGRVTAKKTGTTKIKGTSGDITIFATVQVEDETGKDKVKIVNGVNFVAGLRRDGTVWTWGKNTYGNLGNGTKEDSTVPVQVLDTDGTELTGIKDVAALGNRVTGWGNLENAKEAMAVLKEDGTVWTFGGNDKGQLGNGTNEDSVVPVQVITDEDKPLTNIAKIYNGSGSFFALTENGEIYAWGLNTSNQLGDGTATNRNKAKKIEGLSDIIQITTGYCNTIALKADGTAYGWGSNSYGGLGIGNISAPTPRKLLIDDIKQVVASTYTVYVLKDDGTVWGSGYAAYYLGSGTNTGTIYEFEQIKGLDGEGYLENIVELGANYGIFAKDKDGEIYSWGSNQGNLGVDINKRQYPQKVLAKYDEPLKGKIDKLQDPSNVETTFLLGKDGTIWAAGNGKTYNTLFGEYNEKANPYFVQVHPKTLKFEKLNINMNLGSSTTLKLGETEGINLYYPTIDKNNVTYKSSDETIAEVDDTGKVTAKKNGEVTIIATNADGLEAICKVRVTNGKERAKVRSKNNVAIALKHDGSVWSWGKNPNGALGNGTNEDSVRPVQVLDIDGKTPLNNVIDIAAQGGTTHGVTAEGGVALKKDGTVVTWGGNNFGQLGNGKTEDSNYAVQVIKEDGTPLTNVVEIGAGEGHAQALLEDGSVYLWGYNNYNEVNTTDEKTVNVAKKLEPLKDIIDIEIGYYANFFTTTDNYLFGSGYNQYGALGSNGKEDGIIFITNEKIKKIVSAYCTTGILKEDGTVWTMGYGTNGNLGNETNKNSSILVQVKSSDGKGFLENVKDIGGADGFFALTEENKLYAWGQNNYGQSGLGDTTNKNLPVEVKDKYGNNLGDRIGKLPSSSGTYTVILPMKDGSIYGAGYTPYGVLGQSGGSNKTIFEPLFESYLGFDEVQTYVKVGNTIDTKVNIVEGLNLYGNVPTLDGMTYVSSNEDVAIVDYNTGKVKALKRGETTITATNENGEQARCIVYVISNKKEAITLPQVVTSTGGATIVLKEDGTVWTIGYNVYGELANGTTTARYELDQVKISETTYLENVIKITEPSPYHVLAVTKNGEVYSWGYGNSGPLGLGEENKKTITYATKIPSLKGIVDITSSRYYSSKALTNKGEVYTFGNYSTNQTGDGTAITATPKKVETMNNIVDISAGFQHFIALKGDGTAWTAGSNSYGELGNGTTTASGYITQVKGEEGYLKNLVKVEAVDYSTTAIDQEGNGYVWGHNDFSQLGTGDKTNLNVAKKIYEVQENGPRVIEFGGANSSLAYLLDNGEVYVSGKNDYGQLSQGNTTNLTKFKPAKKEDGSNLENGLFLSNGADGNVFSVIQEDGSVWMAGYNGYGQLITGDTTARNYLTKVGNPIFASKESQITLRLNETYQLEKDNFWYENEFNVFNDTEKEVGTLTYESLNQDIAVVDVDTGLVLGTKEGLAKIEVTNTLNGEKAYVLVKVVDSEYTPDVVGGYQHTLALKNDGTLWGWGSNAYKQLGKIEEKIVKEPIPIIGPDGKTQFKDVKMIETGYYHSVVLTKDGSVYTWGRNANGQLGDGTKVDKEIPVKVTLPEKIVKVAAHMYRTVALSETGKVYVWGNNFTETPQQLDILSKVIDITGSHILREDKKVYLITNLRKQISGLENVISIESGYSNHLLALRADGKVYTYGGASYGQDGQGEVGKANEVRLVKSPDGTGVLEDIIQIKSTLYGGLAMDSQFNVYYWGYNGHAQSGNNKTQVVNLPYQNEQLENVESVARTKGYHNMVIDNAGYVWSIGRGGSGELGNGTTTSSKTYGRIGEIYVEPEKSALTMKPGEQEEIFAKVKNSFNLKKDEVETTLTYRIIDTDIAEVEGYKITAKQEGRTYLVIESEELGTSATVEIQVLPDGYKTLPEIESGNDFTVALKADGSVWTWGTNKSGQLGTGDLEERNAPFELKTIDGINKEISVGMTHSLVLSEKGEVYSFGTNRYGELGNGTTTNGKTPEKVLIQEGKEEKPLTDIIKIKAGKYESFAIDKNFDLWAWGWQYGKYAKKVAKLEGTDVIDVTEDYFVKNDGKLYRLKDLKEIKTVDRVKHLSEGYDHTVMITEDNKAYSIGKNKYGQLGNGNNQDSTEEPVGVRQADGENLLADIKDIKAGEYYTIARTKDNKVYIWGSNKNNRLGQENDVIESYLPIEYTGVGNALMVSAGYHHTTIVDEEGFVWNFGQGNLGQLGNYENKDSITPVMVGIYQLKGNLSNITIQVHEQKEIEAGVEYFNLLKNGGEDVEYKSFNEGIATVDPQGLITGIAPGKTSIEVRQKGTDNVILIQVEVLEKDQIAKPAVETNGSHSLILKADGSVYSFGQNTYGQLGDKTTELKDGTVRVQFNKSTKITQIETGVEHNLALDTNGNVWSWGRNNYGQVGAGGSYSTTPVRVTLPEKIVKIAAGNDSSYAIGQSGKAYSWGYNLNGELGIGSYKNANKPTEIVNKDQITDISAGANHAILVDQKGEVYTTGSNIYGQLGIEKQKVSSFTKVEGVQNIAQVEAGDNHNIIKTVNDEIYTWGSNIYGQLGLNDRQNRAKPVKLEGKTNILEMSAGKANSILLENSGKVYTVGANNYGQIGDTTTTVKQEYTEVTRIPDGIDVATGDTFSLAIRRDGTVWAWGDYNHGAPEMTSKTKSIVPVMVGKDTSNIDGTEMVLKTSEMKNIAIGTKEKFNVFYDDTKYASDYTYESLNPEIAKINEVGTVIGVKIGTTWVRAIDKETGEVLTTIVRVIENTKVAAPQIEGGDGFTVALKGDGTIWTWGYNPEGALGDGTYETALVPRQANIIKTYRNISVGRDHALALRNNGTVWAWGSNQNGQLGIENHKNSPKLVQVHNLENVKMIAAGSRHSVAVDKNGIIYGWGSNNYGQLGLDSKDDVVNPTIIAIPDSQVISVAAGNTQTVYVTLEGDVYGMGSMLNGKLEGISNILKVAVGSSHIVMLKDDGTLWEYKNGVISQIAGINNAIDISAQNYTSTYQDRNGQTYTWGVNIDGQLGTNDTEDRDTPSKVTKYGDSTFRVGAGFDNSYIIRNDGFVYASGKNNYGQLGNSTQNQTLVHTLVGDREFKLVPDNKIMTVNDKEELEIECKTFNMFNDDQKDKEEYEWETSNDTVVSVDNGNLTAKAVGTATITATDKVTNEKREAVRVVMPVEEQRIKTLTVDGEAAKVIGDKQYSVTINSDKDIGTLKVVTNDGTDKISIDFGNTYSSAGTIVKEIDIPDKTNTFTIRVQTSNGTELDYTLEVIKKSKNMNLANLMVNGVEAIAKGSNEYEMVIDENITNVEVEAQTEHKDASISINGEEYKNERANYVFEMNGLVETVPVTVKAECGITTTYMLTIYKKSALIDLSEVKVNGKEATRTSENTYNVVIDRESNTSSVVVNATYELAKIAIGSEEAKVKTATSIVDTNGEVTEVEIHVTAEVETENGIEEIARDYILTIYKARINAKIDLLTVNGTVIIPSGNTYTAYLPNSVQEAEVRVVSALDTDKIKIAELEEGTHDVTGKVSTKELNNTYTIRVIDGETEAVQNYTLNIIKPSADTSVKEMIGITSEEEQKASRNLDDDSIYELKMPDNLEEMTLRVVANSKTAKVGINNSELQEAQNEQVVNITGENVEIPVIIEAEDGTTKEYKVKILKIATDNTLAEVTVNGKKAVKAEGENAYDITLEEALTEVEVKAITNSNLAKLYIESGEYKLVQDTKTITIDSKEVKVPIRVKAESGDTAEYTLRIHGLPDNINAKFTVDGEEGEFIASKNKYRFKVNTKQNSHTLKGVMEDPKAKIQIGEQEEKTGTASLTFTNDAIGSEFEVYVTSQNGLVKEKVIIEIAEKSSNTDITYVSVGGEILEPDENGNYQAEVKHNVEEANVAVKLGDSLAKVDIAGIIEELAITEASVPITAVTTKVPIKVTAEDGTTKTVTLTITRLNGETGLRTLSVDGKAITKAEDGKYYYTMERKDTAKIVATATNAKATVSIAGNEGTVSSQTADVETELEDNNIGILITAEDGTEENYELIIHKISNDNLLKEIKAIGIEDELISATGENTFEIKVPSDTEKLVINPIANNPLASIKLKDEADTEYGVGEILREIELTGEETKVALTVKAEDGTLKEYEATIIKMSSNTGIGQILVNGEEAVKSDTEAKTYDYYLKEALSEVTVTAKAFDIRSKIAIGEADYTVSTQEAVIAIDESLIKVRILVQSEEKVTVPYYLNIHTLPDNVNAKFTLDGEEAVYDSKSGMYILKADTRNDNHELKVTPEDILATVNLADQGETVGEVTKTVTNAEMGNVFNVIVKSQNKLVEALYQVKVIAKETDSSIQTLTVNNKVLSPDANGNYELKVAHNVTNADIELITNGKLATAKIGELAEGVNKVTASAELTDEVTIIPITITAEDGTKTESILTITKMSGDTEIANITVDGTVVNKDEDGFYRYTVSENTQSAEVSVELANILSKVSINGEEEKQGTATEEVVIENEDNSVIISITAEDGTTKQEMLIIHRIATDNTLKTITAKGISQDKIEKTGEDTYHIEVPYTQEELDLTAIANHKLAKVKLSTMPDEEYQEGKMTANIPLENTETQVEIMVQAENGTVKTYRVTITKVHVLDLEYVKANGEALTLNEEETGFSSFVEAKDTVSVDIKVKDSTTKIELMKDGTVIDAANGNLVTEVPMPDTSLDLSFRVTLEDGSEAKDYTIHFDKKSQDNSIEYLTLDDVELIQVDGKYEKVVDRKDSYELKIKATNEYAKIKVGNSTEAVGTYSGLINMKNQEELVTTITVVSQNGEEAVYELDLRKISDNTNMKEVKVDDVVVEKEKNKDNYHIFIKRDKTSVKVSAEIESEYATIRMNNGEEKQIITEEEIQITDEITTVEFVVKAENGEEKVYTLTLEKESNNNNIEILKANNETIEPDENGEYNVTILDTLRTIPVYVKTENAYAQIQIGNNESVKMGQNTINVPIDVAEKYQSVDIIVTAQNGTEKLYTLNITRKSDDTTLEYLKVNGKEIGASGDSFETIIDLIDNVAQIDIKTKNENATIRYKDREEKANAVISLPTPEAETEMEFVVISEMGTEKTYKVKLVKKSNDMTLKTVTVNGAEAIKQDDGNYYIEVLDQVEEATVRVATNDKNATVRIGFAEEASNTATAKVELPEKETEVIFTIRSEAGNTSTAKLTIKKVSNETGIEILTVDEEEVTDYDAGEFAYKKIVDNEKQGYYVLIMAKDMNATVSLDGEEAKGSLRTFVPVAGQGKEIKFTITAENGDKQEYSLTMIKASDNVNVELVELNDFSVTMTDPDKAIYEKMIPKLADTIKVRVVTEDEYATVKIGDTKTIVHESIQDISLDLREDVITIPVVITAADGYTVKTYNIILKRGQNNTDIMKLTVEGKEIECVNSKYVANITGDIATAEVGIKLSDEKATVEFNNEKAKANLVSEVTLEGVKTVKDIIVTAEDGTIKHYTLEINKLMSIAGTVNTKENVNDEHIAKIDIYRSSDSRPIEDENDPREVIASGESSANGKFDIVVPDIDTYDVVITKPGYLSYTIRRVKTTAGKTSKVGTKELIAGDVIETGHIEIDDLSNIVDHYGELPVIGENSSKEEIEKYNNEVKFDLNGDNVVDKLDRNIVRANYDKQDVVEIWQDPSAAQRSVLSRDNSLSAKNKERSTQKPNEYGMIKPMEGDYEVTSIYGTRTHPVTGVTKKHTGIDIAGVHHTEIYSVADGEVVFSGSQNGFGNCIEIKHNINGKVVYSFYAHLSRIDVKVGDKVSVGDIIALEGGAKDDPNPGSSTGHHLHFELRNASGYGNDIDPTTYIKF